MKNPLAEIKVVQEIKLVEKNRLLDKLVKYVYFIVYFDSI